ncbi:MAG: hypothetical protein QW291_06400 [Thermofilaceae archaeon]
MQRRFLLERASSLIITSILYVVLTYFSGFSMAVEHVLLTLCMSVVHPGLGPAGVLVIYAYNLVEKGGINLIKAILFLLPIGLSFRYWIQVTLWTFAVITIPASLSNAVILALFLTVIQNCTVGSAAALLATYAIYVSLELYTLLPTGVVGSMGLVVSMGGYTNALARSSEIAGDWIFTNLIGPPSMIVQAIVYAASGATASKLKEAVGKAWMASLASTSILLMSFLIFSKKFNIHPTIHVMVTPLVGIATSLLFKHRNLRITNRISELTPSNQFEHLANAWEALNENLRYGEKIILVFGPGGCGKTHLVTSVCKAQRLKLSINKLKGKGEVVLLEHAEQLYSINKFINKLLMHGVRSIILECRDPAQIIRYFKELKVLKAVYVPPPDINARLMVLINELEDVLPGYLIEFIATSTEMYSIRALLELAKYVKELIVNGIELQEAVKKALSQVKPDIQPSELANIEKFIVNFEGIITGFASPLQ